MNKAIGSLAVLKVNWDHYRRDYVENFVPFVATLIAKQDYDVLEPRKICEDFATEYGLIIPQYGMMTILKRLRNKGCIKKAQGRWVAVKQRIVEIEFSRESEAQMRKQEKVVAELISYARDQYNFDLDKDAAETALLSFLSKRNLDILCAAGDLGQEREAHSPDHEGVLPKLKTSKKQTHIVNRFVLHVFESEPELFGFVMDMTIGHILATALVYHDFNQYFGRLNRVGFYFDTRFVLRLLGIEGEDRKAACAELLGLLSEQRAKLFVFKHTFDETITVLYASQQALDDPARYPVRPGSALNYFRQQNYTSSDVEQMILRAEKVLAGYGVAITDTPDPKMNQQYQIDESRLQQTIVETYRGGNPNFDEFAIEGAIARDIKTIAAIHKLRQGRKPVTIKDAVCVFVTPNSGLVSANRLFEANELAHRYGIPACLTDVLVGTIVWVNSPAKVLNINQRNLMADCYAALQPDPMLVKRYVNTIEMLRDKQEISAEEFYLLRSHRTAMNLLAEKTMGDPDEFSVKTVQEIYDEIVEEARREQTVQLNKERELHVQTKERLEASLQESERIKRKLSGFAEKMGFFLSWALFVGLLMVLILALIYQPFNLFIDSSSVRLALNVFICIITILNIAFGLVLAVLRKKVAARIQQCLVQLLGPE